MKNQGTIENGREEQLYASNEYEEVQNKWGNLQKRQLFIC